MKLALPCLIAFSWSLSSLAAAPALLPVCDRTPAVREKIEQALGLKCGDVHAADLARVTEIDLYGSYMGHVARGDFSGLTGLKKLDLSYCRLGAYSDLGLNGKLPAGLFDGLTALESLDIGGNSLSSLSPLMFKDLKSLRYLGLQGNNLGTLNKDSFTGMSSLTMLYAADTSAVFADYAIFDFVGNLGTVFDFRRAHGISYGKVCDYKGMFGKRFRYYAND